MPLYRFTYSYTLIYDCLALGLFGCGSHLDVILTYTATFVVDLDQSSVIRYLLITSCAASLRPLQEESIARCRAAPGGMMEGRS